MQGPAAGGEPADDMVLPEESPGGNFWWYVVPCALQASTGARCIPRGTPSPLVACWMMSGYISTIHLSASGFFGIKTKRALISRAILA